MTDTDQPSYLIYSHEHRAWWKPGRRGYTINLFETGIYPGDEAERICADACYGWLHGEKPRYGDLPAEVMVPRYPKTSRGSGSRRRWRS